MQIQVVKKSNIFEKSKKQDVDNTVTLLFKKSNIRYQGRKTPIVSIYDENNEYLPCSLKLTQYPSRVPSSLLAKWINANCAEKLLTLVDRAYTVERVKDGIGGGWYFTNKEDALYGLHRVSIKENLHNNKQTYCVVKIDDSIGMSGVKNILLSIGISLICEFDTTASKMKSITLKFKGD